MKGLYEGMSLSQAMEKLPKVFPPLYIALIRSSEQTGNMIEALGRYVDYQLQVNLARKKIVSASIYPILLIIVGLLVIGFLMFYVIPKFSVIYDNIRGNLPWMSQVLLAWGRILQGHLPEIMGVFATTLGLLIFGMSRPGFKRKVVEWLTRIPALGERLRIYQLARFYRTMGMLLDGGIPVVTALEMVDGLLQPNLRSKLKTALQDIREGQTISVSMEKSQLTTPVAVRMLRVGERSGKMGEMMERIGAFYEGEIARWIDWFTRLFEPVLMIGIGLLVGTIVVLMYMPIFELAGSIQ